MPSNCDAGEDSWKSLGQKEIKPVNLKGDQPWIFTGRTDAEAQYFGHLIQLPTHWRSPWCWETLREKRASADEMARWYHWCNGHELGQTLGDGEGQEGLACCSPWDCGVRHNWETEQQQAIYLYLLNEIIHTTHTHTIINKCSLFTTISFAFHLEIYALVHLLFAYNLFSGLA